MERRLSPNMTMRGNWTMRTMLHVNNLSAIVDAHVHPQK